MADAGAQTEIFRAAEALAGDDQEVFLELRPVRERLRIAAGCANQHIERAGGIDAGIAVGGQGLVERFPVAVIGRDVRAHMRAVRNDALDEGRRADVAVGAGCAGNGTEQLMAVGGGVRHENVADTFAGHTQ